MNSPAAHCTVCRSLEVREWSPNQNGESEKVSFLYTFRPEHCKTFPILGCDRCTHAFSHPIPEHVSESYVDVIDKKYVGVTPLPENSTLEPSFDG